MKKKHPDPARVRPETRLVIGGREYSEHGFVNPAVYHASTVLFPDVETLYDKHAGYRYGRRGTPTSLAVESAIATVEGGFRARVSPSGLAAATTALLSFLKAGEHLLMVDTVYAPVRHFCDTLLKGLGIETTYYDPLIGGGIAGLIRSNTKVVYCESPGSLTMEVQDVPAIAAPAHSAGALVMIDNTWSAGHFFKPFSHGCDVSIQAATKYFGGHSDVMMGAIICSEETWPQLEEAYGTLGQFAGPDDMNLTLRGLRTLDVRLERHQRNAMIIAEWLRERPEVETVLYPALSNAPGHDLWKRDFIGASGLFSIVLKQTAAANVDRMLNHLNLFGMGASWGGYESLILPFNPHRTAKPWSEKGPCLRLHIGFEHPDDLIADLSHGFKLLADG